MSFFSIRDLPELVTSTFKNNKEEFLDKVKSYIEEIENKCDKINESRHYYYKKFTQMENDAFHGLEKITTKKDGRGDIIGIKNKHGVPFYCKFNPEIEKEMEQLKNKINELTLDIKKVSKEKNRLLGRAKHDEENLRQVLRNKVKLVHNEQKNVINIPYEFHEHIGLINLKQSKLFFLRSRTFKEFTGDFFINDINVSKQRSHSFPLRIGDEFCISWDRDYFENFKLEIVEDLW